MKKIEKNINNKNLKKCMIIFSFFINLLFYYFPDELALFKMSLGCSKRVGERAIPQYQ